MKKNSRLKIRILTVGVYDYFHYGHLRVFQQAKAAASNGHLIVAVQESDYIRKFKPEAEVFYTTEIRCELIRALRCVDDVITYRDVSELVTIVDFDVLAIGEDQRHEGFCKAEEYCKQNGKKVVRMHRTPGVSSSKIKDNLMK